ncbi:MAG: hypothetical protein WC421_02915 [Elusimicrobiales bacterium]
MRKIFILVICLLLLTAYGKISATAANPTKSPRILEGVYVETILSADGQHVSGLYVYASNYWEQGKEYIKYGAVDVNILDMSDASGYVYGDHHARLNKEEVRQIIAGLDELSKEYSSWKADKKKHLAAEFSVVGVTVELSSLAIDTGHAVTINIGGGVAGLSIGSLPLLQTSFKKALQRIEQLPPLPR